MPDTTVPKQEIVKPVLQEVPAMNPTALPVEKEIPIVHVKEADRFDHQGKGRNLVKDEN